MGPARVGMDGAGVACSACEQARVSQDHPGTVAACHDQGRDQTCGCEGCDQPGLSHDVARLFGTDDGPRTWESTKGWTNRTVSPVRGDSWNEPRYDAIELDLPWLPEHRGTARGIRAQTVAANVLISPMGHADAEDSSDSSAKRPTRHRGGEAKRQSREPKYQEHHTDTAAPATEDDNPYTIVVTSQRPRDIWHHVGPKGAQKANPADPTPEVAGVPLDPTAITDKPKKKEECKQILKQVSDFCSAAVANWVTQEDIRERMHNTGCRDPRHGAAWYAPKPGQLPGPFGGDPDEVLTPENRDLCAGALAKYNELDSQRLGFIADAEAMKASYRSGKCGSDDDDARERILSSSCQTGSWHDTPGRGDG